jgi:hypothetical protein
MINEQAPERNIEELVEAFKLKCDGFSAEEPKQQTLHKEIAFIDFVDGSIKNLFCLNARMDICERIFSGFYRAGKLYCADENRFDPRCENALRN